MTTPSVDDDLHGPSIDAGLGVEDMASLVFILLMLKCQDFGDNESGARILITKDLIIFVFSLRIMVRLLVHWKDLWPRPPHVKHLIELVLTGSSGGAEDEGVLDL